MNDHEGVGVLPGRYAGEPIRIHSGPTPREIEYAEAKSAADALAGKIAAAAAFSAQASASLLELVGQFDETNAVRFWTEVKSVAHRLAWSCSMTLPTAREHVRVARALRRADRRRSLQRGPVVVFESAGGHSGGGCGGG